MFVIINETDGICEGTFDRKPAAEIIKRNLEKLRKDKNYKIYDSNWASRPTEAQLYTIGEIERNMGVQFNGITKRSASEFISCFFNKQIIDF